VAHARFPRRHPRVGRFAPRKGDLNLTTRLKSLAVRWPAKIQMARVLNADIARLGTRS
jgi:hypothetical protein